MITIPAGTQVWVAAGTYVPDDRAAGDDAGPGSMVRQQPAARRIPV